MKYITSPENPIIKKITELKHKKSRGREGHYLIEGMNLCKEALDTPDAIDFIFIRESTYKRGYNQEEGEIIGKIEGEMFKGVLMPDKLFDKLVETQTPQGIAAVMKIKKWDRNGFFEKDSGGNLLVLDKIQDPGNAGTLLRTAEAAAFHGILAIKGTVDLYSPKAVRAAAGSILRMPVLFTGSEEETIEILRQQGKQIVVASPHGGIFHFRLPLGRNTAFVIGNEGGGAAEAFLNEADHLVKIPMDSAVDSLNAAVAGGILIYESVRQNINKNAEEKS